MGDVLTESMVEIVKRFTDKKNDNAFYVADLADVLFKVKYWRKKIPRVRIFFAVKCNNDPMLLKFLASIGCGFDCASKVEIEDVLLAGAHPRDVIFAHPVKPLSHLCYAASVNVDLMTFDSEQELRKIKDIFPSARLVIRIKTPIVRSALPLSDKFGCDIEEVEPLLQLAKSLQLNAVGVSFHVGSLCEQPEVFATAIGLSRQVVDIAKDVGFHFEFLDIGGGFNGFAGTLHSFDQASFYINQGIKEFYPEDEKITIIAEPGHYICTSAYLLCGKIIGKKIEKPSKQSINGYGKKCLYYMNIGLNTTFHFFMMQDFLKVGFGMAPLLNREEAADREVMPCRLWGVTRSTFDCLRDGRTVELEEGEHLVFINMGGYSHCFANRFNGFPIPQIHHIFSDHSWYEEPGVLPLEDFLKDLGTEQLKAFLEIKESISSRNSTTYRNRVGSP